MLGLIQASSIKKMPLSQLYPLPLFAEMAEEYMGLFLRHLDWGLQERGAGHRLVG